MKETEKFPVLDHIVETLKNAIADAKVENQLPNEYKIKDGNDEIHLKQELNDNGSAVTVLITDKRRIIFSEDLLETLQDIHEGVKGNEALKAGLKSAKIIINDLDIETEMVFQAIKDFLDQVSNSYEFIKAIDNEINKIGAGFKFGKHIFRINITNDPAQITIEPRFNAAIDTGVQKTVTDDVLKVQKAVNKMFKGA